MFRASRLLLVCATSLTVVACGDSVKNPHGSLTATDVTLTTDEDAPISADLATAGSSGAIEATVTEQGTLGTLTFIDGMTFTYTPNADVSGDDVVSVSIASGSLTASARVHVTITPVDDPPALAAPTTLTIEEDSFVDVALANVPVVDVDSDVSTTTLTLLSSDSYSTDGNELRPRSSFSGDLDVSLLLANAGATAVVHITVTVTAVNDAPVISAPEPQQTATDTPFVFVDASRVAIADIDATDSPMLIELGVDQGAVTLASTTGLTFTIGDGTDDVSVSFSGGISAINAALTGMRVTPPSAYTGLINITLGVNDQGATGAGGALSDSDSFVLGVGGVDLPPFNTIPSTLTVDEDTPFTFAASATAIAVGDVDADSGSTVSVNVSVASGKLTLASVIGLAFTAGDGTDDASMAFSGTFAAVNNAFDGMVYTPTAEFSGSVVLVLTSTSDGLSDNDILTITVRPVNDAPSLQAPPSVGGIGGDAVGFTGTHAIIIDDVDVGTGVMRFIASVTHGTLTMSSPSGGTLTGSGTTVVAADGTRDALNAALAGLSYTPDAGFTSTDTLFLNVNDNGKTGAGGARASSATVDIVTQEAVGPTAIADHYTSRGNTALVVAAPGVLANDLDPDGTMIVSTTTAIATTQGGTATLTADGGFTYTPAIGFGSSSAEADDTFSYTVQDEHDLSASATVTVSVGARIWYVDNVFVGTSDGGSATPFTTVSAAAAAADTGDFIFIAGADATYPASITLHSGVSLVGGGVDFDRGPNGILAKSTAPQLVGTGSAVIRASDNCSIQGITISATSNQAYAGISANTTRSVSIANVTVDNYSPSIDVDTPFGAISIQDVTLSNSMSGAINVVGFTPNISVDVKRATISASTLGVYVRAYDSNLSLTIDDSSISGVSSSAVYLATDGTATPRINVLDSTFENVTASASTSSGDTGVRVIVGDTSTVLFDIEGNTFAGWSAAAIGISASSGGATLTGLINANIVDNTIPDSYHLAGIYAAAQQTTDTLDVTITNNTVGGSSTSSGIEVLGGGTACAGLSGNSSAGAAIGSAYLLDAGSGTLGLVDYNGTDDIAAYLSARTNTGAPVSASGTLVAHSGACAQLP